MKYYADTAFLLSLHLQETTSAAAVMQTVTEPLPVTPLVTLEFRNALRLAVFRPTITEPQRAAAWTSFGQDLAHGALELTGTDAATCFLRPPTSRCSRSRTGGVTLIRLEPFQKPLDGRPCEWLRRSCIPALLGSPLSSHSSSSLFQRR